MRIAMGQSWIILMTVLQSALIYLNIIHLILPYITTQLKCNIFNNMIQVTKIRCTQICTAMGKWVPLCCTLGAVWIIIIYYRSLKFESNNRYLCIRKTILNGNDLSA
ncbi:Uncharacterized protein FWK35_00007002 [Aphis craccivora]|uniref:Uncharacterized protein n=1 Tax=Aphis craccivora TaxID=307492 RepID=A0A6G0Z1X5_APHCR|nr:Uncharacterized protein FWK35_00007002 [Aphis craccivora]